ncbi:MAG TPA: hypothetical protein VMO47_16750, partial [Rhodothermales bacterium]|nr:hypothetical protein [Rhodothermales bacterium]
IREVWMTITTMYLSLLRRTFSTAGLLYSLALLTSPALLAQPEPDFSGRWKIDREKSTPLDPWSNLEIEISIHADSVSIVRYFGAGSRVAEETMALDMTLPSQIVTVEGWWDNRHIGAYLGNDKKQTVAARWLDEGRTLQLNIDMILETSQGETPVRVIREMRLSDDGNTLTTLQIRSSRNLPVVRVFNRI